jgi:hypothetical protein
MSHSSGLFSVIARQNAIILPSYNVVQANAVNGEGASLSSITATLPSTATSGNLIVAAASLRLRSATITFSGSGWTYIEQKDLSYPSASIAYKISDGTETSVTASHSASVQRMSISVIEIENVQTGSIDTTFTDNGISTTGSFSTGTISGQTQFPQMALGIWAGDDDGTVDPGARSYTSGYTEIAAATTRPSTSNRAHVIMAIGTVESGNGEVTLTTANSVVRGLSALVMAEDDNAV